MCTRNQKVKLENKLYFIYIAIITLTQIRNEQKTLKIV